MSYKKSWRISLVIVLVLMMALGSTVTGLASYRDWVYQEAWDGRGSDSLDCSKLGEEGRTAAGWIHWVFSTKGDSTDARLVLGGSGEGVYDPGEPLNANVWHFYTPYFEIDGLLATVYLNGEPGTGQGQGDGGGLVISDYCPGVAEVLAVSKTAETSFEREHFWDIEKMVTTENNLVIGEEQTPKIWLFTDGRGDEEATWTVDVSYEGYEDSEFVVSGEVKIENTGQVAAKITDIKDLLAGEAIAVDFGEDFELPYTLAVGQELIGTYSEVVDEKIEGENVVTVTTERSNYEGRADIVWGDPVAEFNKTVTIKDISDLFGEVELGEVTAPNNVQFTYDKGFAWADYGAEGGGSFEYDNVARIIETGQQDEAKLKVNVQEFLYESAWAKGEGEGVTAFAFNDNGFSNWGWSNKISEGYEGSWTLWAGAAQSDTSKGTDVGNVFVEYSNGELLVEIEMDEEFMLMNHSEAVYAGSNMFPTLRNGRSTVAPGQYSIEKNLSGEIYVIVHGVVGMPDPNFGP